MDRRALGAKGALFGGMAVLVAGSSLVGHAASAADCSQASCADAAWVTACNAADACKKLDQLKSSTGWTTTRSFTPATGLPDPSTARDVRRAGPHLEMRKRPVVAPTKVVAPHAPSPRSAGWASAPGAPSVIQFDRRALALTGAAGSNETAQGYALVFGRAKAIAAAEDALVRGRSPLAAKEAAAVVNQHPAWVGDPRLENYRARTSHSPVSSCEEYGYKKQFEYMWFSESAKALGSDYRAIYDLATQPGSPVRQRDRVLHTYGTADDATFMLREDWDHHDLTVATTNLMLSYAKGSLDAYSTGDRYDTKTAWEKNAQLEAAHRAISDEELADIERRMRRFSDLLAQLWGADFAIAEAECKRQGYPGVQGQGFQFTCLGKPGDKPPGTAKGTPGNTPIVPGMDQGGGGPAPVKHKAPPPRTIGDANAQRSPRGRHLGTKSPSAASRTASAIETMSQVRGLVALNKAMGVNPSRQNGSGTTGGGSGAGAGVDVSSCKGNAAQIKACYLQAAADAVQADIDKMIAFEKTLPGGGCLNPDPIANACNWSYKQFAEQIAYRRPDLEDATRCRQRIPDWGALTDPAKQDKLIAQRILYTTDGGTGLKTPIDYTSDIKRVDAFLAALDAAPAQWLKYEQQRLEYMKYVNALTAQTKAIPAAGDKALGESKSDGFDLGHPETFAAGAHYALSWGITAAQLGGPTYSVEPGVGCAPGLKCCNSSACGVEERVCRYAGALSASADAKASVFGTPATLVDAAFAASADTDAARGAGKGAQMNGHFTFLGNELMPADVVGGVGASTTGSFSIARPLADTSAQIPDPPIEVAFMVGPIPVTLQAGSVVSAGIDLSVAGVVGDTCALTNVAPPFSLVASIAPRAKADAFGQAGVDLVAVSAGARVDLNLVTLGLPLDVGFKTDATSVAFDTRADLVASALAGAVSLFAEVRYVVGSDTYEIPVFSWAGVQGSKNLFDYNVSFPLDALSYRFFTPQVWRPRPL